MKLKDKILRIRFVAAVLIVATSWIYSSEAARIKDVATIEGVSESQVIGYGLVAGLNQTGDNQRTGYTVQSVTNMLKRFGLTVPQSNPRMRDVAAVIVTADVPAFLRRGSKIDVTVSAIGDATSLEGGILLMTPMSLADGSIVGMAQGALSVGGYDVRAFGSRIGRNYVTTARIPNGLILERTIESDYIDNGIVRVVLRDPDFTTATRTANQIRAAVAGVTANPVDAATIEVQMPAGNTAPQNNDLIAQLENLNVQTDVEARVIINERTGTIVVGGNVELLPAVVAHGGLDIYIQKQVIVTNPAPFTVNPPSPVVTATVGASEDIYPPTVVDVPGPPPTVADMAQALNALELKPRDLIAIFQALKASGSLQGELIIQ